jgi:Putative restriction endonuclease
MVGETWAHFITIEGRRHDELEDLSMGATTKLTFEEFLQLPEEPGKRFELDRGELIVEPSPTFRHNVIRERIARHLKDFVAANRLGAVTVENDFRLAPDVVRNPDVAFIASEPLRRVDVDISPIARSAKTGSGGSLSEQFGSGHADESAPVPGCRLPGRVGVLSQPQARRNS